MSPHNDQSSTLSIIGAVSVKQDSDLASTSHEPDNISIMKGSKDSRARPVLQTYVLDHRTTREFIVDDPDSSEEWETWTREPQDPEYRHKKEKNRSSPQNNEFNLEEALNKAFWMDRDCRIYRLEESGSAQLQKTAVSSAKCCEPIGPTRERRCHRQREC